MIVRSDLRNKKELNTLKSNISMLKEENNQLILKLEKISTRYGGFILLTVNNKNKLFLVSFFFVFFFFCFLFFWYLLIPDLAPFFSFFFSFPLFLDH